MHTIIQVILSLVPLKYQNVQPLLVLYLEKGMPVNDYSLKTLNICFYKFYRKFCNLDVRRKCFTWLASENMATLDSAVLREFLIRLICNENLPTKQLGDIQSELEIYDDIFFDIEKGILYSDFENVETKHPTVTNIKANENLEINDEMYNIILTHLEQGLSKILQKLIDGHLKCIEFVKNVTQLIAFLDSLLKNKLKSSDDVKIMSVYSVFKKALKHMYAALTQTLKSDVLIRNKVMLLKCLQEILLYEYDRLLNTEIRIHIDEDCFHCIYDIIKRDIESEDDTCYETDIDYSMIGLKQNCIYLLAAYCRKQSVYTDEISKCILEQNLYNFTSEFEIDCAFRCIMILNDVTVEQQPLGKLWFIL